MTSVPGPESIDDLLARVHVVALPMRVRFRGVTEREAVLLAGPCGWAEWAPFPEYDDADAARWLAAAVELGWGELPPPVRETVGVNATVPAVPAARKAVTNRHRSSSCPLLLLLNPLIFFRTRSQPPA